MGIYIQYIYNKNCGVSFWTCSREISGKWVALLTLQITVCLSCQTQKAMHNALCDVMWQKNKYKKKIFQKKYSKKNKEINFTKKLQTFFPHKICIVSHIISHSSYHTRRITLPRYFRWNMTNIGAINITLVYDKTRYKCCAQHNGRVANYCHVPLVIRRVHITSTPQAIHLLALCGEVINIHLRTKKNRSRSSIFELEIHPWYKFGINATNIDWVTCLSCL